MAVYRSDQAQLTFASEVGQGGDLERFMMTDSGGQPGVSNSHSYLNAAVSPGATQITVASGTDYAVGDFIRIGDTSTSLTNSEVRKVEHKIGNVLYLDRALAFYHPGGNSSNTGNSVDIFDSVVKAATGGRKYITFVPGVYETVEVPDMETAIEPRYFLGTQSRRNFFQAYKGQQSFSGSVGDMVLLNGWPLRFPIGSVTTFPLDASDALISDGATSTTLAAATDKGDIFINPTASLSGVAVGDYLLIEREASPTPSHKCEVRKVAGISGSSYIELDYPLMFAHASSVTIAKCNANTVFVHHILETVDLDTVSWHVHMRDSSETAANDFDRRYVGGMVGSLSLGAEEGGLVTVGWDSVPFLDMVHNQRRQAGHAGGTTGSRMTDDAVTDIPRFALMQSITADDVNKLPGGASGGGESTALDNLGKSSDIPNSSGEPYYFSRGSVKINGTEFARIRAFSLSIANNEEPRYYITQRFGRHRGPSEIREQQREYSMTADVVLPDTGAAFTETDMATATSLFKELLLEGDYGTDIAPNMKGFTVSLRFDRGTNDYIVIDIQGLDAGATSFGTAGTPTAPASGGNNQGVFIRTAPHGITGDNPMQVSLDLMIRNLKVTIVDKIGVYP